VYRVNENIKQGQKKIYTSYFT